MSELEDLQQKLKAKQWTINFLRVILLFYAGLVLFQGHYYLKYSTERLKASQQTLRRVQELQDRVNGLQALTDNVMKNCNWRSGE